MNLFEKLISLFKAKKSPYEPIASTPWYSPVPSPTPMPKPTATPTPTPIPNYGRSKVVTDTRRLYPERYKQAQAVIAKLKLPQATSDLAMDVAGAENSLKFSGGNGIPGNTSTGMFAFNEPTWKDYLAASESARLAGHTKDNPDNSAQAFAYMISQPKGIKQFSLSRWNASKPKWSKYYSNEELKPYYR